MPTAPRNRASHAMDALDKLFSAVPVSKGDVVLTSGAYLETTLKGAFELLWRARARLATDGEPNATFTNEIDAWLAGGG